VEELRRCKIVLLFELKSKKEYVEGKSNKDPGVNLAVKDVVPQPARASVRLRSPSAPKALRRDSFTGWVVLS
jgi:hypothetical protein